MSLVPFARQVLGNRLDASWTWKLSTSQRDELSELCRRHGFDPHDVRSVEYLLIDGPVLAFEIYVRSSAGRVQLHPEDLHRPFTLIADRALRGELPLWWQPCS